MPPPYDYVTVLDELYSLQNGVSSAVLEGVAAALGEPRDCFSRHIGHGDMGTIRLISYPGSDDPSVADADVGIAPHTDFEAFTLMHQTSPGLQFLHQGGDAGGVDEWIEAPVGPFCVIIGDVLERFTNGLLRATPHRVLRTAAPRMSLIRFNAVAPETLITPLPAFVSEVRPPSTPVTMAAHGDHPGEPRPWTRRAAAKGLSATPVTRERHFGFCRAIFFAFSLESSAEITTYRVCR